MSKPTKNYSAKDTAAAIAALENIQNKTFKKLPQFHEAVAGVLTVLKDKNPDPNAEYFAGTTIFSHICTKGYYEIISKLIEKSVATGIKIDLNASDNEGSTPLMLAISNKRITVATTLLNQESININATDKCGNSALVHAALLGSSFLFQKLIDAGATTEGVIESAQKILGEKSEVKEDIKELVKNSNESETIFLRPSSSTGSRKNGNKITRGVRINEKSSSRCSTM
jgi:ankyrin repeat protein